MNPPPKLNSHLRYAKTRIEKADSFQKLNIAEARMLGMLHAALAIIEDEEIRSYLKNFREEITSYILQKRVAGFE